MGVAVGIVLVLVGAYVAYLEARLRALEEAHEAPSRGRSKAKGPAGEREA